MKQAWDNRWFVLVTVALCYAIGWTVFCFYEHGGILKGHVSFANKINKGTDFVMHPGIFWLSGLVHKLTFWSVKKSLIVITSLHVSLIVPAILYTLRRLDFTRIGNPWVFLGLALAIMVMSPIGLPLLAGEVYDYAYLRRTVFLVRNTTLMVMLPYGIVAFGLLVSVIQQQISNGTFEKRTATAASIFLMISSIIKPSFAVSIIPSIGLYLLWTKQIPWRAKISICFIFLPTAFLVLTQISVGMVYNPLRPVMSLVFAPLHIWSDQNKYPLLAFMLANAFSLFILSSRYDQLSRFTRIAWINVIVALLPYMLLTLKGPGDASRDLEWPYITARQILYLCSTIEWWKWVREKYSSPSHFFRSFNLLHIGGILLIAHTLFGCMRLIKIDKVLALAYGFRT